jgi:G3E family GTPase
LQPCSVLSSHLISQVYVESVVTVVDAAALDASDFLDSLAAANQIGCADILLLNKVDLLPTPAAADVAERKLRALAGRAAADRVAAGRVPANARADGAGWVHPNRPVGPVVIRCRHADVPLAYILDTELMAGPAAPAHAWLAPATALSTRPRRRPPRPRPAAGEAADGGYSAIVYERPASRPLDPLRFEELVSPPPPPRFASSPRQPRSI